MFFTDFLVVVICGLHCSLTTFARITVLSLLISCIAAFIPLYALGIHQIWVWMSLIDMEIMPIRFVFPINPIFQG
jgi:hypothetical protein